MRLVPATLVAAVLALAAPASAQSIFTTSDDARLVGARGVAVTPSLSSIGMRFDGESERFGTLFGARVTFGDGELADLSVAIHRLQVDDSNDGVNFMSVGAKVPLMAGRVAVLAPLGFSFGSGIEVGQSVHIDPGVVFTTPISKTFDLNPSARVIIPFCDGCTPLLGFEVGVGILTTDSLVNLRPTFGVIVNPRESGVIWTIGGAMTFSTHR